MVGILPPMLQRGQKMFMQKKLGHWVKFKTTNGRKIKMWVRDAPPIKEPNTILSIAQLIIAADIIVHQYQGLTLEQKKQLIIGLQKAKEKTKYKCNEFKK